MAQNLELKQKILQLIANMKKTDHKELSCLQLAKSWQVTLCTFSCQVALNMLSSCFFKDQPHLSVHKSLRCQGAKVKLSFAFFFSLCVPLILCHTNFIAEGVVRNRIDVILSLSFVDKVDPS